MEDFEALDVPGNSAHINARGARIIGAQHVNECDDYFRFLRAVPIPTPHPERFTLIYILNSIAL